MISAGVQKQITISFTMSVNGLISWTSATSFQDKSTSSRGALTIGASTTPSKSWLRPNARLVKNFAARLAKVSAVWTANVIVTLRTAIVPTLLLLPNSMAFVQWIPFVTMIAKEVSWFQKSSSLWVILFCAICSISGKFARGECRGEVCHLQSLITKYLIIIVQLIWQNCF